MRPILTPARRNLAGFALLSGLTLASGGTVAAEPDAKTYWKVEDIRPGMKGQGQTVLVGTKLETFGAEVLGVMKDVSPGRDMILCRLTGCNLEHAGIMQGMSGSPIYIDGKLLGAVAYAYEFAKDPIAGVTPFEQMVQFARSSDRRVAAEAAESPTRPAPAARWDDSLLIRGRLGEPSSPSEAERHDAPRPVAAAGMAGMKPIATPISTSGFTPQALAYLERQLGPVGMAPMAGGGALARVVEEEGDKPLVPGAPLSIGLVTGDFDMSGIGTVTHVEGGRVYGFGHPMLSLGACEFPMMTGYIHTVFPRASVSMKLGSPLKVVGVVDTDVSTCVAGRIGAKPDMLPVTVTVQTGRYSEPSTYRVEMVREPNLLPSLVMSVLTNAIDTEGNLPEELTARIRATIKVQGHEPVTLDDTLSGPRYTGPMGPTALFSSISSIVSILARNPLAPLRIESIDCNVAIESGRRVATIESVRLSSDRIAPGEVLKASVTLKPFKGERETVEVSLPIPTDFPEGTHEVSLCDMGVSLRRQLRNEPQLMEPRHLAGLLEVVKVQTAPRRTAIYLHVARPDRGLAVEGQSMPNLPESVRAVFASKRRSGEPGVRSDMVASTETRFVVEGTQALKFTVVKDSGLSLRN